MLACADRRTSLRGRVNRHGMEKLKRADPDDASFAEAMNELRAAWLDLIHDIADPLLWWWPERARPWLVAAGARWSKTGCDWLRVKLNIPRRR